MKVYVKLFAQLRAYHPGPDRSAPLEVELPAGARILDLAPALQLPPRLVRNAFVNNQTVTLEAPLHDGDQVRLFSPVVGG